ncbi:(d)CMP kinase, partial [Oenococcus oeni]
TERQRQMTENSSVVMDGRDIGTTVLPNADVKIFLIASVDQRAIRRFKENKAQGSSATLDDIKKEIVARDYKDSHRLISPLRKDDDAIEIDTSNLTVDQVVNKILKIVKTRA